MGPIFPGLEHFLDTEDSAKPDHPPNCAVHAPLYKEPDTTGLLASGLRTIVYFPVTEFSQASTPELSLPLPPAHMSTHTDAPEGLL
jgi:hypothetical protein